MVMVREKGKSSFDDVSRELLYIYVDLDGDGLVERYNLFNDALQDVQRKLRDGSAVWHSYDEVFGE